MKKTNSKEQNKILSEKETRPVTRKGILELVYSLSSETPSSLIQIKEKGLVNQIYRAETKKWGPIIIRAREKPRALAEYDKEKWCVGQAAKRGVPVPSVISTGDTPFFYTIETLLPGKSADEYQFTGDYLNVWRQIGEYAREINSIPTKGFGKHFQWTPESGRKFPNWKSYIVKRIKDKIDQEQLVAKNIIDEKTLKKVMTRLDELKDWRVENATLAHGGLAFKNTMVDRKGRVTGIIDWDSAASVPNPTYEFAHDFFWMQENEIEAFLDGYELAKEEFLKIQRDVYTLMLLRGLRTALWYVERNEPDQVERTKKKLKPALDSL